VWDWTSLPGHLVSEVPALAADRTGPGGGKLPSKLGAGGICPVQIGTPATVVGSHLTFGRPGYRHALRLRVQASPFVAVVGVWRITESYRPTIALVGG
jgi:hypothetical protein